ncbi:MAG: hypothetical protein P8Z37_11000, partial [Acidobacteriota bacterium]
LPIVLLGFSLLLLPGLQKESSTEPETVWNPANTTITRYEPVLAVRASGCITCHAEVYSSFITDFGSGDSYFFGNPSCGSKVGPFNGSIYGDFIAESGKTGWLTARFHKDVIVPQASIDFNLRDAAGNGLKDQPAYQDAFNAATLSKYIETYQFRDR